MKMKGRSLNPKSLQVSFAHKIQRGRGGRKARLATREMSVKTRPSCVPAIKMARAANVDQHERWPDEKDGVGAHLKPSIRTTETTCLLHS